MSGRLALVFDDGYVEDYRDLFPVLAERDAPASLAIVPPWLGEPDHLSVAQLDELVDAGWEVVAHGRRHRYLGTHPLAADAATGDDRVALGGGHVFPESDHALYPGDAFEVTDGERTETHTVVEKGTGETDAATVTLDGSLSADFAAGETVLRPTETQVRDEVVGARSALAEMGFAPTTFALPYDAGDPRAWRAVAGEYDALANAAIRSLPNPPGASPLDLQRYYLETDKLSPPDLAGYLDLVADRDGLGILAGHGAWETVTPERVGRVVDAARERGIDVTTVREATGTGDA